MYITIFIQEVWFTCFPKWFEITIKYYNLAYLFRFAIRLRCHINLTMSLEFFDLFELFLKRDLIITLSQRFLLKWGFLFFIFLISYFLRSMFFYNLNKNIFKSCTSSHSRHTITNIQFKLVTIILFEIGILIPSVQTFV